MQEVGEFTPGDTYAVGPAVPARKTNKRGTSKISNRAEGKKPISPQYPQLFFRDPASCGHAADIVERAPTRDRDKLDVFREDAPFLLKDLEDQKYETMAEILQVPIGTIRSRLHRARLELREVLEKMEVRSP